MGQGKGGTRKRCDKEKVEQGKAGQGKGGTRKRWDKENVGRGKGVTKQT